jgi:hypothetical protein
MKILGNYLFKAPQGKKWVFIRRSLVFRVGGEI